MANIVIGDETRLRQILINLISNAIKFTQKGEITVFAEQHEVFSKAVTLHCSVKDTGIGMSDELQKDIFGAFKQADSSISRKYGGTGLGLAICSRLAKKMGGRIWVESREGAGSTFHFTVSLSLPNHLSPSDQTQLTPAGEEQLPKGLRVLLVEDNAVNQRLTVKILERQGCDITVAGNGKKALIAFKKAGKNKGFNIILMDLEMPGMNGFETTAAIRKAEQESGRHTPIVAITAHAMSGVREQCIEAGMDGYVSKPITIKNLLREMISQVSPPGH